MASLLFDSFQPLFNRSEGPLVFSGPPLMERPRATTLIPQEKKRMTNMLTDVAWIDEHGTSPLWWGSPSKIADKNTLQMVKLLVATNLPALREKEATTSSDTKTSGAGSVTTSVASKLPPVSTSIKEPESTLTSVWGRPGSSVPELKSNSAPLPRITKDTSFAAWSPESAQPRAMPPAEQSQEILRQFKAARVAKGAMPKTEVPAAKLGSTESPPVPSGRIDFSQMFGKRAGGGRTPTLQLSLKEKKAHALHPSISTGNLASHSALLSTPDSLSGTTNRHARSTSDVRPALKTSNTEARRSASRERPNERMSDGALAAAEDGDAGVERWFAEVEEINERIFAAFRRQDTRRVKVAILDTGIDIRNAVFQDQNVRQRIKKRVCFLDGPLLSKALDTCGHGTHCAALVSRVAPAADLYIGRVARDFDSGVDEEVVARAIRTALGPKNEGGWDVDVLSLSFGFPRFSAAINSALDETLRSGKLVLAAASNNGTRRGVAYPASRSGVIAIHAASADGKPCGFNPYAELGNNLSILGKNVEAAWTCHQEPDNPAVVRRMTGTSVATPIAAGVVALLLEMAMLDTGDPATKSTLKRLLPMLKTYDGMMDVLRKMAVRTQGGDYHNIIPWRVLTPSKSLADIAIVVDWALDQRFGSQ
ncbi:peptidase S8/S53 domain-containing protein [Cercophora newfieldiana]|uniref:Peptidase S8/S53 domain-containing protein n=1 Tax=Cercophora newfieldiana TaxID=92897 RepID=A0AA39Y2C9_9PEZI|nr:peptidase S8/S53 domain-containing protein [Cercophora newfieldiana]